MAYTTITDPSAHFQTALYNGSGGNQSLTNTGNSNLQPDWVWIKKRAGGTARNHILTDSSRGVTKCISTSLTDAEFTNSYGLTAFGTDGFTVGSYDSVNESGGTYVGWQWKANGGTTASNSNGTITSTVQANTTAGFSIISYTGNGTNGATIGHGLSQTPQIFFPKCLSTTTNWEMYYFPTGGTKQYGYLNLTNAFATWSYTAPTSTTIGLSGSGDSNGNGRTMIGYAFHSVQGYSKIGTYTGNGNANGPFVYTGFKPAWIMFKQTGNTGGWTMKDNKRSPQNPADERLLADVNNAESTGADIDFLSNGFKCRTASNAVNGSESYIYMAFAENPFVATNGVPTTAR
jgi:hypothetical protein